MQHNLLKPALMTMSLLALAACSPKAKAFDPAAWAAYDCYRASSGSSSSSMSSGPTRWSQLDALEPLLTVGTPRNEIIALLGVSSNDTNKLTYCLGPTMIDYQMLEITFDAGGNLVSFRDYQT